MEELFLIVSNYLCIGQAIPVGTLFNHELQAQIIFPHYPPYTDLVRNRNRNTGRNLYFLCIHSQRHISPTELQYIPCEVTHQMDIVRAYTIQECIHIHMS